MGLFRELGNGLGTLAGTVVGGPIKFIGEVTGASLLEDIGDGVKKASAFAGDTIGTLTDGAVNTVSGIVQDDVNKRDEGLNDMGAAVGITAKGVYYTAKNAVKNSGEVIVGAIDGDMDMVKKGASGLVTTVAVGALAIGVVDVLDGADGVSTDANIAQENTDNQSPGTHDVKPGYVEGYTRADGTVVSDYYRDGDGNPNTQLTEEQGGGYDRSNPDNNPNNNLNV
ncbi:hypothetical protein ACIQZI_13255 [Peribacillus sp. NPDC096379]|uniref:hypothetical protein n=1 Tax=Peribacillus sp. NPDC096379 TaxID=3364393 RepID=UPI0038199FE5